MSSQVPPPSSIGGTTTRSPGFDEQDSAQAQKERQDRALSSRIFSIKYNLVGLITIAAIVIAGAALLIFAWFITIFIVHYTIPNLAWLTESELKRLAGVYGNFAKFAAPAMLGTNAWLVAYFGSRRWFRADNG